MPTDAREEKFVLEYLIDRVASRAALRAGFAVSHASSLMAKPHIRDAIKLARLRDAARCDITRERVLAEIAKVAFANLTDFVQVIDGQVYVDDTGATPEIMTAAISEIKETKEGVSVKLHSKVQALALLAEHFGITKPDETPDNSPRPVIVLPDIQIPPAKP